MQLFMARDVIKVDYPIPASISVGVYVGYCIYSEGKIVI